MADDLLISNDGDYVDDGRGGFQLTATAQPAMRHQLLDRFNEWIGDPRAGREQRGIRGRVSSQRELDLEVDSVFAALETLQAQGMIDDIEVQSDRDQLDRFAIFVRTRDVRSSEPIEFQLLDEFGD